MAVKVLVGEFEAVELPSCRKLHNYLTPHCAGYDEMFQTPVTAHK